MRSSKAIEAEGSMGMARASGLHEPLTAGGRQDGDGASTYGACESACLRTGGGHALRPAPEERESHPERMRHARMQKGALASGHFSEASNLSILGVYSI
jgi:hypothetical protein